MPELPEVERTARRLRGWVRGRAIECLVHADAQVLKQVTERQLAAAVRGVGVRAIARRAKYLLVKLANEHTLLVHLGMTGKLVRRAPGERPDYSRLALALVGVSGAAGGEVVVHLVDPRKLGAVRLVATRDLARHPSLAHLGPEPLSRAFTPRVLGEALDGKRGPLKVALMDQAVVAGIGNIQSAEGLWKARLDPFRPAGSLQPAELARLVSGLRWTLTESLARDRGAETTYVSESKDENPFVIYGRKGEPCPRCGSPIERRALAGRGTYWCPRCQA